MLRTQHAFGFALGLLATACGGSSGGGGTTDEDIAFEIDALRSELFVAGVQPLASPPQVSDELFELGRMLFFDKILSGNREVSCATCHLPQFGTSDGRNLSDGVHGFGLGPNRDGGVMLPRNSPALFAMHAKDAFFWDGRVQEGTGLNPVDLPPAVAINEAMHAAFTPGLEVMAAQAMLPPVSREEMRGMAGENDLGDLGDGYNSPGGRPESTEIVWVELTERLLDTPGYLDMLRAAYPGVAVQDFTFAHAGNAIAAFEARAFGEVDSPFQRFVRGDDSALTRRQVRGGLVFFGAGCAECHSGPMLSDGEFHNTGMPQIGPGVNGSPALPFPGPIVGEDHGRENFTQDVADRYRFRTPSLHNVGLTGPWGHAGQFERLEDMVSHYRDVQFSNLHYDITSNTTDPELVFMTVPNGSAVLATVDPLVADPKAFDVQSVVEFLESLSAEDARDMSRLIPSSVPSGLPVL